MPSSSGSESYSNVESNVAAPETAAPEYPPDAAAIFLVDNGYWLPATDEFCAPGPENNENWLSDFDGFPNWMCSLGSVTNSADGKTVEVTFERDWHAKELNRAATAILGYLCESQGGPMDVQTVKTTAVGQPVDCLTCRNGSANVRDIPKCQQR
ncbi:MAG: hypothetical protein FWG25_06740 [Promicromonosporaceae bacterium]|nr:hypothetical protein [Promicromonosporaceae bacterium]